MINKEAITLTAAANTKIYDSTTSASATPTVTSGALQGSDSFTGLTETYNTANAGTGKTLTVSYSSLNDGNGGNNYTVTKNVNTSGVINKATLTITAVTNTKTYDSTTSAAATPTVSGLQGSDTVTGLTETYDTANAGMGKTLTASYTALNDGNSGGNYNVSTTPNTSGVINKEAITLTAAANTKIYDSTTSASATPTVTSEGITRQRQLHGSHGDV